MGSTYAFFALYQYLVPVLFSFFMGGFSLLLRGLKLEFACFEVVGWWFWFVLFGFIMSMVVGVKMSLRMKGAPETYEFNPGGLQYRSARKQAGYSWKDLTEFRMVGNRLFFKSQGTTVHALNLGALGKQEAQELKSLIQKRATLKRFPLAMILGVLFLASALCLGAGIYQKNNYTFRANATHPDAVWNGSELQVAYLEVQTVDHNDLYLSILKGLGTDKATRERNVRRRVIYHFFRFHDGQEEKYDFPDQGLRGSLWPSENSMYLVDDEGANTTDAKCTAMWKFNDGRFEPLCSSEEEAVFQSFAKPREYLECLQWTRWKDLLQKPEGDEDEDEGAVLQNPVTFSLGDHPTSLDWHTAYDKETKKFRETLVLSGFKEPQKPETLVDLSNSFGTQFISREEYEKFVGQCPVVVKEAGD